MTRIIAFAIDTISMLAFTAIGQTCPDAAGVLTSFDNGGIQYLTGMGTGNISQYDMSIQSNGNVVSLVAGNATSAMLMRLNTDGTL